MASLLLLDSCLSNSRGTHATADQAIGSLLAHHQYHAPPPPTCCCHVSPPHYSCRADYQHYHISPQLRSSAHSELSSAASCGNPSSAQKLLSPTGDRNNPHRQHHRRSPPPPPARSVLSDPLLEDLQRLATSSRSPLLPSPAAPSSASRDDPRDGHGLGDYGSRSIKTPSASASASGSANVNGDYLSVSRSSKRAPRRSRRNTQALRTLAYNSTWRPKSSALLSFKGISELYMVLALTMLGIAALLQKAGLLGLANSQVSYCTRCEGFGIEPCNICRGRGIVTWEGKLKRSDPCPLCFGSCKRKCTRCGGVRARKGVPPFLQQPIGRQRS